MRLLRMKESRYLQSTIIMDSFPNYNISFCASLLPEVLISFCFVDFTDHVSCRQLCFMI